MTRTQVHLPIGPQILWNHSCSMVSKFLLVRGHVISWVSNMSLRKTTVTCVTCVLTNLQTTERVIFLIFYRVLFPVNTSMRPVIAGK